MVMSKVGYAFLSSAFVQTNEYPFFVRRLTSFLVRMLDKGTKSEKDVFLDVRKTSAMFIDLPPQHDYDSTEWA